MNAHDTKAVDVLAALDDAITAHDDEIACCGLVYTDADALRAARAAVAELIEAAVLARDWIHEVAIREDEEGEIVRHLNDALARVQGEKA